MENILSKKTLLFNGTVYTGDPAHPTAENMLIDGSRITAPDSKYMDCKCAGSGNLQRIDLKGGVVLPGFHDSHLHMLDYGLNTFLNVDLSRAGSIGEVKDLLRQHIQKNEIKPGSWIIGYGWDHMNFSEKRLPTSKDLDQVSLEHYIFLKRTCFHIGALNSPLLKLCGITKEGPPVELAQFRDKIGYFENGEPNGLVFEKAIPKVVLSKRSLMTQEEIEEVLLKAGRKMREAGLTAVQSDDIDAFSGLSAKANVFRAFLNLRNTGRLPLRVYEQVQARSYRELADLLDLIDELATDQGDLFQDDMFSLPAVKIILDGTIGGRTAFLRHPYIGTADHIGALNFSDEEFFSMADLSYEKGYQIACHCIGSGALDQFIRIIEKLERKHGKRAKGRRPRVVHCQLTEYDQIVKLAELGAAADIQPAFVPSDRTIIDERLRKEDQRCIYGWKTLLEAGVHISGSSDSPVETFEPFYGIRCAVTRSGLDNMPAGGYRPHEKLTVKEAIDLYTKGPAYNVFKEREQGMLKTGFFADFIVVDQDPYRISQEDLHKITVRDVYVAGRP